MSVERCHGKRKFTTFTQAKGAARNASRNNNEPMRPYMCRDCHKFHIGNANDYGAKIRVDNRWVGK
jgi:nitrate/TMAO reductase-like tetraheme cytochrome c subunit